jgi:hypothetical protein
VTEYAAEVGVYGPGGARVGVERRVVRVGDPDVREYDPAGVVVAIVPAPRAPFRAPATVVSAGPGWWSWADADYYLARLGAPS